MEKELLEWMDVLEIIVDKTADAYQRAEEIHTYLQDKVALAKQLPYVLYEIVTGH